MLIPREKKKKKKNNFFLLKVIVLVSEVKHISVLLLSTLFLLTDSLQKDISVPLIYSFNTSTSTTLQKFTPICINQEEREIQLLCAFSGFKAEFIISDLILKTVKK